MTELPGTPVDFFAQLLAGGALYGLVVTWLLDGLLGLWEGHAGAPISETKRRWLSIAVALLVPVAAYGGLCGLGAAVLSADGLYSAVLVGIAATAGKQVVYAGRESLSKPQGVPLGEQPAYRAAHDASGDPDAMRAVPAPDHAPDPASGAPSLADTLAADMGLDPRDITPEDHV
jgi:hypothetical protein